MVLLKLHKKGRWPCLASSGWSTLPNECEKWRFYRYHGSTSSISVSCHVNFNSRLDEMCHFPEDYIKLCAIHHAQLMFVPSAVSVFPLYSLIFFFWRSFRTYLIPFSRAMCIQLSTRQSPRKGTYFLHSHSLSFPSWKQSLFPPTIRNGKGKLSTSDNRILNNFFHSQLDIILSSFSQTTQNNTSLSHFKFFAWTTTIIHPPCST